MTEQAINLPDGFPTNPPVPVAPSPEVGKTFEQAAYMDMRKMQRLRMVDGAASLVTLGGDNLRLNYALIGLLIGAVLMFAVWQGLR